MPIVKKDGFDFTFDPRACAGCQGNCCRGRPGNIWVNTAEIYSISDFLRISIIDFIQKYLRPIDNRYSLREIPIADGFDCVFFDAKKIACSIYTVRPFQCRQFPFWEIYRTRSQALIAECPGVKIIIEN